MNITQEQLKEIIKESTKEGIKEAIKETNLNKDKMTLTINETAEFTGIGRSKILELVHGDNDFPSFCVGKKFLINKELVSLWVEKISNEGRIL